MSKSGFRFDLKNSLGVWIPWIWILVKKKKKRKDRNWIQESAFGFSQKTYPNCVNYSDVNR